MITKERFLELVSMAEEIMDATDMSYSVEKEYTRIIREIFPFEDLDCSTDLYCKAVKTIEKEEDLLVFILLMMTTTKGGKVERGVVRDVVGLVCSRVFE